MKEEKMKTVIQKAKEQGFTILRVFENGKIWGYSYIPGTNQFSSQPGWWNEEEERFVRNYNSLCCTEDCNIVDVIEVE